MQFRHLFYKACLLFLRQVLLIARDERLICLRLSGRRCLRSQNLIDFVFCLLKLQKSKKSSVTSQSWKEISVTYLILFVMMLFGFNLLSSQVSTLLLQCHHLRVCLPCLPLLIIELSFEGFILIALHTQVLHQTRNLRRVIRFRLVLLQGPRLLLDDLVLRLKLIF